MEQTEQPINWWRAILSAWAAATLMMAVVDIFYMLGITPFCFEVYLGSLIFASSAGVHLWTVGLLANWILAAVFSVFYGFFFEDVFRRSGARPGVLLGLAHAALAAAAIFPFFNMIRDFMGIRLYSNFGFFGAGLGPQTPIILLLAHVIFGTTMGTFYGPVGRNRVHARFSEWEDQEDRAAA